MSAHAPKIGALEAYAAEVLSERGRARVERHLAACAECRRALAAIEVYRRTLDDVREAPAPELDWSKMELALALAREAREVARQQAAGSPGVGAAPAAASTAAPAKAARLAPARRGLPRDGVAAIVLAVAAVLALALWPRSPGAPIATRDETPTAPEIVPGPGDGEPQVEPAPAHALAAVTLTAGRAHARGAEGTRDLEVGSEIFAGETIATAEGSSVHAAVGQLIAGEGGDVEIGGAGIALAGGSELALARGAGGEIELALTRGAVRADLGPELVRSGSRFVVLAAEHRFVAEATRFEVELESPQPQSEIVTLAVTEGEVAVHRPDGTVIVVRAPGTWSSADGDAPVAAGDAERQWPHAIGEDAQGWPVVRVERPGIVRWEVGGVAVDGADSLAMRAAPGELEIAGFDAEGNAFRTVALVGADGLSLGADALVPEPPRVREGFIPEEDVVDVVRAGTPRLRQCYELALRTHPDLEAHATARVTIAFDGTVQRVRLDGDDLPPAIAQCVQTHVSRWIFPPPQGGSFFRFDVPLGFSPTR